MTETNTENKSLETPPQVKTSKASQWLLWFALLSLFFSLSVAAFSFYFYKNHLSNSSIYDEKHRSLSEQLASQQKSQKAFIQQNESKSKNLQMEVAQLNRELSALSQRNELYATDIQTLQRKIAETNVREPNDWILSEVEYLVNLSGRKLWLEHDVETSIALLNAADQRIVEMRDPSLNPLRRALLDDIHTLEELPKRDLEKVALALSSLERRVNRLVINSLAMPDAGDNHNTDVSSDINDWQANIEKSWHTFVESFIVISHRDTPIQALLSPEQDWYLKENLINHLSKAQFAVYRQNQDAYDEALRTASLLVETYYDMSDSGTKKFHSTVSRLSKQKVIIKLPEQFKSTALLSRTVQQRAKKSFAIDKAE